MNHCINKVTNPDGTKFDPPKNPLLEKWKDNARKNGKPCSNILGYYSDGRPIMNYSCVLCYETECYNSDYFQIPEEDKEEYENYQKKLHEYYKIHGIEDKVKELIFKFMNV